jgi:sugar/nucleoside kinase (ribokinase family)
MPMEPDVVLIGHLAQDLQPDGTFRLGGTVTYAALLAARQGLRVGIVTSAPESAIAQLAALVPEATIVALPTATPTIFENRYAEGHRQQFLRARATLLTAAALPPEWCAAPLTLLGPIADEIAPDVASCLRGPHRAATPQGWLRAWDADGQVTPIPWGNADLLVPHLTALILSVEDLAIATGTGDGMASLHAWAAQLPYVVLTDGPRGATLWDHGVASHIPAFPVAEVDPTGAGDCFATAFLIELWRTDDAPRAVRYAHAAASFVVRAPGTTGIPFPPQIDALLATTP